MRDKLIHGYFGVDLDAVWDTATKDIPLLREKLQDIESDFFAMLQKLMNKTSNEYFSS